MNTVSAGCCLKIIDFDSLVHTYSYFLNLNCCYKSKLKNNSKEE